MPALEEALLTHLLPKDEVDERGAVLEVRAGTGGDEAALFAGDLFRMYQRFAELRRWKFEVCSVWSIGMFTRSCAQASAACILPTLRRKLVGMKETGGSIVAAYGALFWKGILVRLMTCMAEVLEV